MNPLVIPPGLPILARGNGWAVVVKPAGLRSVPGRAEDATDSVQTRIQHVFPKADGAITPHRLDVETSGLMVVALNRRVLRGIARQFEKRKIGKAYEGVLEGEVEAEKGVIELPLRVDWPNRPRQMVCHEEGKPSRTLWRVLNRTPGRTHVEFRPETGRTHQLRVHAVTPVAEGGLGAPFLGDTLYGDPESAPRLHLHATRLSFFDPQLGVPMRFHSVPPFGIEQNRGG